MSALDLVFSRPAYAGGPIDLVFGSEDGAPPALPLTVTITVTLSAPVVTCSVVYDNRLPPLVSAAVSAPHQVAAVADAPASAPWGRTETADSAPPAAWQAADTTDAAPCTPWARTAPRDNAPTHRWGPARVISEALAAVYQQCRPLDQGAAARWQTAAGQSVNVFSPHQVANAAERVHAARMQQAQTAVVAIYAPHQVADHAARTLRVRWQEARHLPTGLTVWVPSDGGGGLTPHVPDLNLVFACPAYVQGEPVHLVFGHVCGTDPGYPPETIVVPIRSVYMTINNFSLFRVDTGQLVPATGLSLSLDVDSWTWNCSFSVQGGALSTIERNSSGDPVILQASINGTPIRVIVEKISRERSFGSSQLRVQGRGIAAELDSPFAPILSFGNPLARTARQLLDDILMFNGVSIGWGFDTTAFIDWLVPAGVFSHTGTYISALNAVVGSIGGYVQPHNTDRKLNVLLRYPTPAWGWSTAIPDMVLPSSVTSQEGIEWLDKPEYNRVFVHGQEGGRVGRYTRLGTAGDVLAPPVVDPLITHVDAERQRGRAILSDTGRIANVTLRLPVLAETGIIRPGRLVEYTDGPVSRIGMSRSVSIDVNLPTIYQTIQVETHVD